MDHPTNTGQPAPADSNNLHEKLALLNVPVTRFQSRKDLNGEVAPISIKQNSLKERIRREGAAHPLLAIDYQKDFPSLRR
jgi:hypothetical protein